MSTETPKQRAELVNKLVDEASMVNTLRSEIKSLNEQLYESKSDCEKLAIRLANRACVPAEPTPGMLEAGLRATDAFAEPSNDVIESGVVVEYGLTQADCDGINAECMVGCAAQYKAMLSAAPNPAGERVSVQREQTCVNCARPYAVEAIDFGICCICERDLIATRTGGADWKAKLSAGRTSKPSREFAKRAVEITMECLLAGRISGYKADPVTITFQYSVDVVADKIIAEFESTAHPAAEPSAQSADSKAGEDDWCPCTGPAAADGPCCDAYGRRCRIAAGQPFASGQVDELAHLLNGLTRLADELSEDGLEQSAVIIRDGAIRIGEIVNSIAAGQPFVEESAGPIQTRSGWFDRGRAQGLREAAKLSRSLDYHCACYEAIEALLK